MKITFINVGYGEAILLELSSGEIADKLYTVMIDGGGAEDAEFRGHPQRIRAFEYLKENGIDRIDLLISTHIHEDHLCGLLPIIKRIEVGEFWCNYEIPDQFEGLTIDNTSDSSDSVSKFLRAVNSYNKIYYKLKKKAVTIRHIYGIRQGVELKNGLSVDILGPSKENYKLLQKKMSDLYTCPQATIENDFYRKIDEWMNSVSIMLRFHYKGQKFFSPSDINCKGYGHLEDRMDLLRADIFKAAHHGQIDGITSELAKYIRPKIVVTCASSDLRYNSSNPGTYEIIEKCSMDDGIEPIFLFSDDIRIEKYSENISSHQATVIEIDDMTAKITYKYL